MTPQEIIDGIVRVAPKYGMDTDAYKDESSIFCFVEGLTYLPSASAVENAAAAWLMLEALKEKWHLLDPISLSSHRLVNLSALELTIEKIVTAFIEIGDEISPKRCEKCGQVVSE